MWLGNELSADVRCFVKSIVKHILIIRKWQSYYIRVFGTDIFYNKQLIKIYFKIHLVLNIAESFNIDRKRMRLKF